MAAASKATYEQRQPGTVPPALQCLLAAAVQARRYLSRSQPLLLDPQVMPRRLWIAPRLIVLTVLGAVLFAPPQVNGQQVDRGQGRHGACSARGQHAPSQARHRARIGIEHSSKWERPKRGDYQ